MNFLTGTCLYRCTKKDGYVKIYGRELDKENIVKLIAPIESNEEIKAILYYGLYFGPHLPIDQYKVPPNNPLLEEKEPILKLTFTNNGNCLENSNYNLKEAITQKLR